MRRADDYEAGFIAAIAHIWAAHGEDSSLEEALECVGADNIDPESVDEFDAGILRTYQKHRGTRIA